MNNLGVRAGSQPLFARKGGAAPSASAQSGRIVSFQPEPVHEKTNSLTSPSLDGLAGLIKRANPLSRRPVQSTQPAQPAQPAQPVQTIRLANDDVKTVTVNSRPAKRFGIRQPEIEPRNVPENIMPENIIVEESIFAPSPRRQLTVRIDMKIFRRLDFFAKSSGLTYQEIQAKAMDIFLPGTSKNKRRF